MNKTRLVALLMAVAIAASLTAPMAAFAGGDQVNRPEDSGYFGPGGAQADGEAPDWAHAGGPR